MSCAGYERDWYLSHGEDWAARAFSTGLRILLDIADDYDPGHAHVGFLVSREGGMALHGFAWLCMDLNICDDFPTPNQRNVVVIFVVSTAEHDHSLKLIAQLPKRCQTAVKILLKS